MIGNGRYYGGAFALFPEARLDDGKLDVCVFTGDRFWDVIRYSQGVWRNLHTGFGDVEYFQADSFECHPSTTVRQRFQLDGEHAGRVPVRFSVRPGALRVVVP